MQFKVLVMAKALLTPHGWDQLQVHRCDPVWPFVCREVSFTMQEGKTPPDELLQTGRLARDYEVGGTIVVNVDPTGLDPKRRRPLLGSLAGDYSGKAKGIFRDGPRAITFLIGFSSPEPE